MKLTSSNSTISPKYLHKPIQSLDAVSLALGIELKVLHNVASRADTLYRLAKVEPKSDGRKRQTFDAFPELKAIQIRIQERILKKVAYPHYLTGSLKGCSPRTNATIHQGAYILFAEDITDFFPSVTTNLVKTIWCGCFGFSDAVGQLLTDLTVKAGSLPQGTVTSPFLANLVFWDYEPNLFTLFAKQGLTYSRYVDDICVSSKVKLFIPDQAYIVSQLYGMLRHFGFRPKRSKHEIFTSNRQMQVTKLVSNTRASLPPSYRQNARAAVFGLESRAALGEHGPEFVKEIASAGSIIGRLGTFHPKEAQALKIRLRKLRATLEERDALDVISTAQCSNK